MARVSSHVQGREVLHRGPDFLDPRHLLAGPRHGGGALQKPAQVFKSQPENFPKSLN